MATEKPPEMLQVEVALPSGKRNLVKLVKLWRLQVAFYLCASSFYMFLFNPVSRRSFFSFNTRKARMIKKVTPIFLTVVVLLMSTCLKGFYYILPGSTRKLEKKSAHLMFLKISPTHKTYTHKSCQKTQDMDVSENRGTPKWMVYNGKPQKNGWFGGTVFFWKHPYRKRLLHPHELHDFWVEEDGAGALQSWDDFLSLRHQTQEAELSMGESSLHHVWMICQWFSEHQNLGGGFKFVFFHPYLGMISNLTNIFQMGWNHQLETVRCFPTNPFNGIKSMSRFFLTYSHPSKCQSYTPPKLAIV